MAQAESVRRQETSDGRPLDRCLVFSRRRGDSGKCLLKDPLAEPVMARRGSDAVCLTQQGSIGFMFLIEASLDPTNGPTHSIM